MDFILRDVSRNTEIKEQRIWAILGDKQLGRETFYFLVIDLSQIVLVLMIHKEDLAEIGWKWNLL